MRLRTVYTKEIGTVRACSMSGYWRSLQLVSGLADRRLAPAGNSERENASDHCAILDNADRGDGSKSAMEAVADMVRKTPLPRRCFHPIAHEECTYSISGRGCSPNGELTRTQAPSGSAGRGFVVLIVIRHQS